jgi:hypothetical protein
MDYKNGKIYKLVCNTTGLQYVGSTTSTLAKRLYGHKGSYKLYQEGAGNYITSAKIIENGNYDIVLVEDYPCDSKDQLHARERYWIEKLDCVNKNVPNRTVKQYYVDNKVEILTHKQKYYEVNKGTISERKRKYYAQNLGVRKENDRKYYESNREKILQKLKETLVCECGVTVTKPYYSKHIKTQKHLDKLSVK